MMIFLVIDILLDFKEEEPEPESKEDEEEEEEEDDDLYLDFDVGIKDSEVPQKIEMPELADDDFLNDESEDTVDIDDLLSIDEEVNTEELEIDNC